MTHFRTKPISIIALSLLFLLCSLKGFCSPELEQNEPVLPQVLSEEQAFVLQTSSKGSALTLTWQIASGCYLYQSAFQVLLLQADQKTLSLLPPTLPQPEILKESSFGEQAIYHHSVSLPISLASYLPNKGKGAYVIQTAYQGCAESGFCYPPQKKWLFVETNGQEIQEIKILNEAPNTKSIAKSEASSTEKLTKPYYLHFILTVGSFYFIGMLLSLTPCVLPMIPILFTVIVGEKHLNTKKAFSLSLCYALSMAVTYALAGILAGTLGKNLQATFQHPVAITIFAFLFVVLGLMQLGLVRLSLHHSIRMKEILSHLHAKQESGTYIGAVVMGILATLISSPCITAPFLAALGVISKQGDVILGGSALLFMGLGIGTVLIFLGTVGGKYMPKSGPWMQHVNHFFAVAMFGLSLWLVDRIVSGPIILIAWGFLCLFTAWCFKTFQLTAGIISRFGVVFVLYAFLLFWGAWLGESDPLKPLRINPWLQTELPSHKLDFQKVYAPQALERLQAEAQKRNQPLLLVYHANWCTSCKNLEHNLWRDQTVQQKLKGWQLVKADVTANDANNQLLLKKFDLYGPPAILFFSAEGKELVNYRIVGAISADDFSNLLDQIALEMKIS